MISEPRRAAMAWHERPRLATFGAARPTRQAEAASSGESSNLRFNRNIQAEQNRGFHLLHPLSGRLGSDGRRIDVRPVQFLDVLSSPTWKGRGSGWDPRPSSRVRSRLAPPAPYFTMKMLGTGGGSMLGLMRNPVWGGWL
jgi:hypothetical protein